MADPKCTRCYGSGSLDTGQTHMGIPIVKPCLCQQARDIIHNLNAAWTGLSQAPKLESTPLLEYVTEDLFITASDDTLRQHLRHVGIRMGWSWGFKVASDADLMVAWLSNAQLVGKEILDPDVASVSSEKASLVDLIEPPALLILRLGVKSARNSAMPEVFLETIRHRQYRQRPTWVVDQPTRRLSLGHLCFSDEVSQALAGWDHLTLGDTLSPPMNVEMLGGAAANLTLTPSPLSIGGMGTPTTTSGGTRTVSIATAEPKKPKFKARKGDR